MAGHLWAAFDRPPVMLLAGLPVTQEEGIEVERALEIQEAVLSFARAAFSVGHPVAVPADGFVAPLLSAVADEYRPPSRSEEIQETPPQLAIGVLGSVEEELGGWSRRAAPAAVLQPRFDSFEDFLESIEPRKVIVVGEGGAESGAERVGSVRERGVELQAVGPTLTESARDRGWGEWDAAGRLLREIGWPEPGAESREGAPPIGAESVIPYGYLMQRLLET